MAYQFTQTGAEIQDILDQVPVNTATLTDINSGFTQLNPASVSISSGWTCVYESSPVPAGLYLVWYGGSFSTNATGARSIGLGTTNTGKTSSTWDPQISAVSGVATRMVSTAIIELNSSAPLCVWAIQNSGSTLTFDPFIRYVRLR